MDLSPRIPPQTPSAPRVRNRRKWVSIGLLVMVLAAGGVVLTKFLTSSLDYYCNVDEVNHKSGCEAGHQMRIQGVVDKGSLKQGTVTTFSITFNKATVPVVYDGDPGGLFQECIPVVIHGVLNDQGVFDGDEVEVKHSNQYEAANPTRINASNQESAACSELP
ncbi:MAG: ccmE [Ilumatobacteraceae bacterium]|nr:ccmE [Ilumatobacteraceae bacterium]MCU1389851.1 ccmE [Ilumatobacteraceae bacterium]